MRSQSNISLKANNDKALSVTDPVTDNFAKGNNVTDVTDREKCDGTQKPKVTLRPAPVLDCDNVTDKTPQAQKCMRI